MNEKQKMSEYFNWINVDKKQRLDSCACDDLGSIFGAACIQRCELTEAACTLIANQWHSERVIFVGDYLAFGDGKH